MTTIDKKAEKLKQGSNDPLRRRAVLSHPPINYPHLTEKEKAEVHSDIIEVLRPWLEGLDKFPEH